MKLPLVALLALLPLAVVAQVTIPYDNCGTSSDQIQINTATADVWPPSVGQACTVTVDGVLKESLSGGSYQLGISLNGWQIISTQGDLSSIGNVTWPMQAGPVTISKSFTLPSLVAPGTDVMVNVSATDPNEQQLLCIGIAFVVPSSLTDANDSAPIDPDHMREDEISKLLEAIGVSNGDLSGGFTLSVSSGGEGKDEEGAQSDESDDRLDVDVAESKQVLADSEVQRVQVATDSDERVTESLLFAPRRGAHSASRGKAQQLAQAWSELLATSSDFRLTDPIPVPYTNCGQPSDLVTIQSLTSTVWPPAAGTTASITASATVGQQITGGTYNLRVSLDGIPLMNSTGALSSLMTLPVAAGSQSMSKSLTLPSSLPFSGSIAMQVSAMNELNQELFCVAVAFTI